MGFCASHGLLPSLVVKREVRHQGSFHRTLRAGGWAHSAGGMEIRDKAGSCTEMRSCGGFLLALKRIGIQQKRNPSREKAVLIITSHAWPMISTFHQLPQLQCHIR